MCRAVSGNIGTVRGTHDPGIFPLIYIPQLMSRQQESRHELSGGSGNGVDSVCDSNNAVKRGIGVVVERRSELAQRKASAGASLNRPENDNGES